MGYLPLSRLRALLLPGLALILWELVARSGAVSPIMCPSLKAIALELGRFVGRPDQLMEAWSSLYRALTGFALAAAVGVPAGLALGRSALATRLVDPVLAGTYPIPKVALYPIFVLAFGIGSASKISLVFLECLYPIVLAAAHGARTIDRGLIWSGFNMGASWPRVFYRIVVPAAAPVIFAGFRVALPIALIIVIVTEMVGSADGLGYVVMVSLSEFRTDRLLAAVIVTALLGVGLDRLLVLAQARLVYWTKLEAYYA
jgi:ABC-type nitrate/sulfonate/bicarbonate transport system permease component